MSYNIEIVAFWMLRLDLTLIIYFITYGINCFDI